MEITKQERELLKTLLPKFENIIQEKEKLVKDFNDAVICCNENPWTDENQRLNAVAIVKESFDIDLKLLVAKLSLLNKIANEITNKGRTSKNIINKKNKIT